jgi:alpha-1,4-fucosyltransferase
MIFQRPKGEPLRVYMDLEAGRKSTSLADIFVSYHAGDDVQATYAGALFHNNRNYYVSPDKNSVSTLNISSYDFLLFMTAKLCGALNIFFSL